MIYIVLPCHFRTPEYLCETTLERLRAVLAVAKYDDQIVVTGDVPYRPGGLHLGELVYIWLTARGVSCKRVSVLRGGVGTFSEARVACEQLKGEKVTLVSSSWSLFQAKPIWKRRARENEVSISFLSAPRTGGWRTVLKYTILGIAVRAAILFRVESFLEHSVTISQESRRDGFTWNGCA